MRKTMVLATLVSIGAPFVLPDVALRGFVPYAAAQPFGFLFGNEPPGVRHRAARPRPALRRPVADIPLPVPRPHFAEDQTTPAVPKPQAPPVPMTQTAPLSKDQPVKETAKESTIDARSRQPIIPTPGPTATPLPPPKPVDIPIPKPAIAASGASNATSPRDPDDDPLCPDRLNTQSVAAPSIAIGPQPDARCTVAQPVKLSGLTLPDGGTIDFPDKPVIACATAEQFSAYVRDLLSPLAKGTFGARVEAVWTGPGLECRSRDHIFGAKLSAHGQGLAIDVAQLKLTDGHTIAVGEPKTPQDTAFETAARAGGCGYFHTVLGPGSDSYHRTHWHFDLEVRGAKGDTKFCH